MVDWLEKNAVVLADVHDCIQYKWAFSFFKDKYQWAIVLGPSVCDQPVAQI